MFLKRNLKKQILISIIKILSISVIVYLLIFYIFGFYVIKSNTMNPSLKSGSLLIYYRLNKNYNNFDVIITNNHVYRIIGKFKDEIDIQNNIVLINKEKEEGNVYFSTYKDNTSKINYPIEIGKDEYFVLNDYRIDSNDSRRNGLIKKENIQGKVIGSIQIRGF